ncbi:MAG: hypothetical protein OHK0013_13600 [Sandaracinaceae bacterium]
MSEFEIKVTELEEGGKSFDLPIDPAWLDRVLETPDLHAVSDQPGRLTYHAALSGTDVVVRGRIRAAVIAPCARCLGDTRIDVDADLTALFSKKTTASRLLPGEEDLTPEDLDREFYSGDTISLDEIVREQVVLEVPMQVRCCEQCPGLAVPEHVRGPASLAGGPSVDGKPIDPRLAPLLALQKDAMPADPNGGPGGERPQTSTRSKKTRAV